MRTHDLSDAEIARRPHRIRGPVAKILLERGAIAPERAIAYAPAEPDAHRDLARLRACGEVKATTDGRCWFDLRCHYLARARRERMRAMIAVPVAIVFALAVMLFYRG